MLDPADARTDPRVHGNYPDRPYWLSYYKGEISVVPEPATDYHPALWTQTAELIERGDTNHAD